VTLDYVVSPGGLLVTNTESLIVFVPAYNIILKTYCMLRFQKRFSAKWGGAGGGALAVDGGAGFVSIGPKMAVPPLPRPPYSPISFPTVSPHLLPASLSACVSSNRRARLRCLRWCAGDFDVGRTLARPWALRACRVFWRALEF